MQRLQRTWDGLCGWIARCSPEVRRQQRGQCHGTEARRAASKERTPGQYALGFALKVGGVHLVMVSLRLRSTLATAVIAASATGSADSGALDSPTAMRALAAAGSAWKRANCCS